MSPSKSFFPPVPFILAGEGGGGFPEKKERLCLRTSSVRKRKEIRCCPPISSKKNIRGVRKRGCNSEPKCRVYFSPFVDATEPNPFSVTIAAAGQKKKRLLRTLPNQKGGKKIPFLLFFLSPALYSIPLPFSPEGGIAIFLSLSRSGGQQRRGKAPSAALPLFPFHISTTSSTFSSPWSVSHGQGKRRRKGKEEFVHASLGWRRKKVPFLWRRRRTEGARPIHGRKEEEEEGEVKGNISLSPFFPFKILAASLSSSWHRGLVQGKEGK